MSASAGAWPDGYDRIVLPEIDSTNAEAARRAPGVISPTWVLALRQTKGRARRGRGWHDPEGNFAATLILPNPGAPGVAAQRSFVAALALAEAIDTVAPSAAVSLKWPNDVLLDGAKVAGILLETMAGGQGPLLVGIGVNLRQAPVQAVLEPGSAPAVSLAGVTGAEVTPEAFLDALASAFARGEASFRQMGFAPIRNAFLARAARLGQTVTARTARESVVGRFADIDADGALLLETAAGPRRIAAADIHF